MVREYRIKREPLRADDVAQMDGVPLPPPKDEGWSIEHINISADGQFAFVTWARDKKGPYSYGKMVG